LRPYIRVLIHDSNSPVSSTKSADCFARAGPEPMHIETQAVSKALTSEILSPTMATCCPMFYKPTARINLSSEVARARTFKSSMALLKATWLTRS